MHKTLKQAVKTNLEPVIISVEPYECKGVHRQWIKARKARGKNVYRVVLYENGLYSDAV